MDFEGSSVVFSQRVQTSPPLDVAVSVLAAAAPKILGAGLAVGEGVSLPSHRLGEK